MRRGPLAWCLGAALPLALACGGEAPGEASPPVAGDTLVVVANTDSLPLTLLPRDWVDLFHPRFADEVVALDPRTSPATAAFLEGILRNEAERTGVAEAGFDWLRRLDRAVVAYDEEPSDAVWRLRRGEAWLGILPAALAEEILAREGFTSVPMESGARPVRWRSADPASLPEPPGDWLATWGREVRGRG